MKNPLLLRNFDELLDQASGQEPALEKVRDKMRATLEDYATSRGTSPEKLILMDVCTGEGKLRQELERHIRSVYPLSGKSRPSYVSCARRLIKAAYRSQSDVDGDTPSPSVGSEIPKQVQRILPFIPREGNGITRNPQKRLAQPYSKNGTFFLLAVLSVWAEFKLTSLESLFQEHVTALHKAIRKIAKEKSGTVRHLVANIRRALNISKPEPKVKAVPIEQMIEPLRTELTVYLARSTTLGERELLEEQLKDERLLSKATRYGYDPNKLKPITVKIRVSYLCRMYAYILPLIESEGLKSFGLKDLLRVTRETIKDEDGEEFDWAYNKYLEVYKESERAKTTTKKRAGYDSYSFFICYSTIRSAAIYNGYFAQLKNYSDAYSDRIVCDVAMIEKHKEIKKMIFTIKYVDEQLLRLRGRFEQIIRTKSFMRKDGRSLDDADSDLTLCIFYLAFVMMRYLSYRQQSLRNCVCGLNIIFDRDGSITLYWPKSMVKNKKPIRVTLTPELFDGVWEPVLHALKSYKDKVYPYLGRRARLRESVSGLGDQFILRLDPSGDVICWDPEDGAPFCEWFETCAKRFKVLPNAAYEADINFNPHFLRGLCMDWMWEIGMTVAEISLATGDTEGVIRQKYFNKNAVQDATRVLTLTDRRLKEERMKLANAS